MVYVKSSQRRLVGSDQPSISPAPHTVDANSIKFIMLLDGEAHPVSITRDVLARLERVSEAALDLDQAFVRQRGRIVGIAGRALSAGVRVPELTLTAAHFAEIADRS